MASIRAGHVIAFFLYDVAEAIDLHQVRSLIGGTVTAKPSLKPTPPYVQYQQPPVAVDGDIVGMPQLDGFRIRFKMFDYGVISVALTRPIPATWPELLARGLEWHDDTRLSTEAEAFCRRIIDRLRSAMLVPRERFVAEDYLIFAATELNEPMSADTLIATHGPDIAQLLRGERDPLSGQERDEVLRHRISYLATDLVVPTWNAAFVYDTEQ